MALALKPHLQTIFNQLPLESERLTKTVSDVLERTSTVSTAENQKAQWELLIRDSVFSLASNEGAALKDPNTRYYAQLCDQLDVALVFTELGACDNTFAFTVISELLETQTVSSCLHIFTYIESRAARLTAGMVPQKGKALVFLKSLNDLLKRLSRTGSSAVLSGRILAFLSSVFPLGERSGQNLRGEYGPAWTPVTWHESVGDAGYPDALNAMEVDAPEVPVVKKQAEFFDTFWSLQLPFSKPSVFTSPQSMPQFMKAVDAVLQVIKQANSTERTMMGSRTSKAPSSTESNLGSAKMEDEGAASNTGDEYFFAEFLTNPDSLELEMADVHFRRQIIFQLLILLQHLLTLTKSAKATWVNTSNRSLQTEFTLDPTDAVWVQDTIKSATKELENTQPHGKLFAETITVILQRDQNWVKWKNNLCRPDFVKDPWSEEGHGGVKMGIIEATIEAREKMRLPLEPWKWALGSESLTDIWAMGYTGMADLENPTPPGHVKDFVKQIKREDNLIDMRRKKLLAMAEAKARAKAAAEAENAPLPHKTESDDMTIDRVQDKNLTSTSVVQPAVLPEPFSLPPDEKIMQHEEMKQRLSWLALRAAREKHLHHFPKVGTGDVVKLAEEIEKQRRDLDKPKPNVEETPHSPTMHDETKLETETDRAGSEVKTEAGIKTEDISTDDIKMSDDVS